MRSLFIAPAPQGHSLPLEGRAGGCAQPCVFSRAAAALG